MTRTRLLLPPVRTGNAVQFNFNKQIGAGVPYLPSGHEPVVRHTYAEETSGTVQPKAGVGTFLDAVCSSARTAGLRGGCVVRADEQTKSN